MKPKSIVKFISLSIIILIVFANNSISGDSKKIEKTINSKELSQTCDNLNSGFNSKLFAINLDSKSTSTAYTYSGSCGGWYRLKDGTIINCPCDSRPKCDGYFCFCDYTDQEYCRSTTCPK